jgi:hypothetical protein
MRIVATIAWCLAVVVVAYRHFAAGRGGHHDAESRGAGQDQEDESGILDLPRC